MILFNYNFIDFMVSGNRELGYLYNICMQFYLQEF